MPALLEFVWKQHFENKQLKKQDEVKQHYGWQQWEGSSKNNIKKEPNASESTPLNSESDNNDNKNSMLYSKAGANLRQRTRMAT